MTRLIDADSSIEKLNTFNDRVHGDTHFICGIESAKEIIQNEPTVQVDSSGFQWIPVSERLPDDDRTKVVTLANGNAEAGYYSNGDWWCVGDSITLENPTVIAWMPLPEPYQEEES
jgi:hypothetical protein